MRRSRELAALLVAAALLAGCTGGASGEDGDAPPPASSAPTASVDEGESEPTYDVTTPTVWLCHPDRTDNPCLEELETVTVAGDGASRARPLTPASSPAFDCFYVYPTVSAAPTPTAPKTSAPEIVRTARAQASAFQGVCRLFVPIYRQTTLTGLLNGGITDPKARETAIEDVVSAFHDYLNEDNNGRPFLLLGHSQGAGVLTTLIQREIDGDEQLRSRLVSAMLLGGAPFLAAGSSTRGSFQNVPPCRTPDDAGCLVAYNTYEGPPPSNALFGRTVDGRTVVCTNPAALAGGSGRLDPIVPTPSAPGVDDVATLTRLDGALSARCRSNGRYTWLDVQRVDGSPLPPTALTGALAPDWGMHRYDVTVALGNLVDLAARQAAVVARRND